MIDLSRLEAALDHTIVESDGVVHQSKHRGDQAVIVAAARVLLAGTPIWYCEDNAEGGDTECFDEKDRDERRLVHGEHHMCGPARLVLLKGDRA